MPMLTVELTVLVAIAVVGSVVLIRLVKGRKTVEQQREDVIVAAALSVPATKKNTTEQPVALAKKPAGTASAESETSVEMVVTIPEPEKEKVPEAEPVPAKIVIAEPVVIDHRPAALNAPVDGKPDALTAILGIGNAIQEKLFDLGIYHFSQISAWTTEEVEWIEKEIGFPRRVSREKWIEQAKSQAVKKTKPASRKKALKSGQPRKPARKSVKASKATPA